MAPEQSQYEAAYDRQTQSVRLLGLSETTAQLEHGVAAEHDIEDRLPELQMRYSLLSQDDILAYYREGAEAATINAARYQAVEMVNELPVEQATAQIELSAAYRRITAAAIGIDSASAWLMAAQTVVARHESVLEYGMSL